MPQYAFVKTFKADIDAINSNYELDLSSFNEDMEKLEKAKIIIEKLKRQKIPVMLNIDINQKEYENLKHFVIGKLDELITKGDNGDNKISRINYTYLIDDIYEETYKNKFPPVYTEHEYMELIYDITIPYIIKLETKNYEILKQNMLNNFEEKIVTQHVKYKTKKIYKIVESYFYKNEKEMDYIKEVKKYCENQKDKDYKDLIKLEIDEETIIHYMKQLIGKEIIQWLKKSEKTEKFSLNSMLFFYQNFSKNQKL